MRPLPQLIAGIRATIESGYYRRHAPPRRERLSLTDAIERAQAQGELPLLVEVAVAQEEGRLLLPQRTAASALIERMAAARPAALSLWVEPRHHAGDLRWTHAARPLPVLAKDWIIDPAQIVGGDAVLISLPLLEAAGVSEHALIEAAHEQGLEAVLEVRTPEQMSRAKSSEADILLIDNHGAGGTPAPHVNTTVELLRLGRTSRPVISSQGIHTPAQVRTLMMAGASAVEMDSGASAAVDAMDRLTALRRAVLGRDPLLAQPSPDARAGRAGL